LVVKTDLTSDELKTAREYGELAYNAYVEDSGGRSLISGVQLPAFDELPAPVMKAWCAAGVAIALYQTKKLEDSARKAVEEEPPGI
jgi:hypothetical protein